MSVSVLLLNILAFLMGADYGSRNPEAVKRLMYKLTTHGKKQQPEAKLIPEPKTIRRDA